MKIVDARSGKLIKIGEVVRVGDDPTDWYTILATRFRSLFSREAVVLYHDGRTARVPMPVKLFPKFIYGPDFPTTGPTAIYPS